MKKNLSSNAASLWRRLWLTGVGLLGGVNLCLGVTDSSYIGINNGTGYDTTPSFVARSVTETKKLGCGSVRMGMDGIGGSTSGAAFTWSARDGAVDAYFTNNVTIHAVVAFSGQVSHGNNWTDWTNNWDYFVRNVFTRYRTKVKYYILDNEPDLNNITAQQCFDFTKMTFNIARSIDPTIQIETPPTSAPDTTYLQTMINLGIADYCDFIGVHAYGGQFMDGRLSKPFEWLAAAGKRKPVVVSESGTCPCWAPAGITGQEWRRRWLAQWYVALKRYGYSHCLLFSLTFSDINWAYMDNSWNPIEPGYSEIKNWFRKDSFSNGGFESANDNEHGWQIYFNPDLVTPPAWITFTQTDAAGAHSGNGYAKFNTGGTTQDIILRRVAENLTPGNTYTLGAYVFVNGGGTARLKALGYDNLDGDAERVVTTSATGSWQFLSTTVVPTKTWVVVELGATGTGVAGHYMKWDDVTLGTSGGTTVPNAPTGLVATPGNASVSLTWSASSGASGYNVKRSTTSGGPYTTIAGNISTTSYSDSGLSNGTTYYYVVSALNSAGESANSSQASATPSGGVGGGIIADGTYRIVARNSGKALEVANHGTANGSNVQQWTYSGGSNQRWTITHLGNNQYKVIGVERGRCLDVAGASTADGANVHVWDYLNQSNQKWQIAATSGGYYSVKAVHSGKALDVTGASSADGANVEQWTWNGGNNQQWAFQAP